MAENGLGFFARVWLAIWLPWVIVFKGAFGTRMWLAAHGAAVPALEPEPPEEPALEAPAPEEEQEEEEAAAEAEAEAAEAGEAAPGLHLVPAPEPEAAEDESAAALHLLAILQREGRFVDFLQEDLGGATDDQVGAAARIVHDGCRKALSQYVTLEPVREEPEDSPVTVEAGFDAARIRLTGRVVGSPPFRGRLAHHGWRASEIHLPELAEGQDPAIIAPAEVEI